MSRTVTIARKLELRPEDLSPEKLFPFLAIASMKILEAEYIFEETCKENPDVELRKPSWKNHPDTIVSLRHILVQHRSDSRKKKDFDPERRKWKSITKIDGAEELT